MESAEGWVNVVASDADVVMRLDRGAIPVGVSMVVRGPSAVAGLGFRFSGAGWLAKSASVNGMPGVVVNRYGRPASIVSFTIQDGKIVAIDILADLARIRQLISRSS
jgi:RNA polymerase sigma-70 factor (ECF subfamily)